jgi:thioredoxin 1
MQEKNQLKFKNILKLLFLILLLISVYILSCTQEETEDISPLSQIPLESVLGNGKPTLGEFGWRECIPCKTMRPILEELEKEYKDVMNVIIIDLPLREDLAEKYGINVMPVQIIFDAEGNEVLRHAGAIDKASIVAQLNKMGIYKKAK